MLVTLDLFSALIDSRTGGSAALAGIAHAHGWPVDGEELYDRWDAANKGSQRDLVEWVPFAEHCRRALALTYRHLGLLHGPDADRAADADVGVLIASMAGWPLWPDVAEDLPALAREHRLGILSNVDDDIVAATAVAELGRGLIGDGGLLTSERLGAYKPSPEIYRRARERAGGELVHVPSSARDVRGALEAGIPVVRLRRPGHQVDPSGPVPEVEVDRLADVGPAVQRLGGAGENRGGT